jgi:hypothetical protein
LLDTKKKRGRKLKMRRRKNDVYDQIHSLHAFLNTLDLVAFASIDWHDFIVVETVEFTEADETIPLPPPISLQELETMSYAQRNESFAPVSAASDEGNNEMEVTQYIPSVDSLY